jgi:uncharacterized protein
MPSDLNEQIVSWLSTPTTYSPPPARVEVIETHISWVFLAGDFVFKLKKPVKFDFLDFSTAEARERACHDEVQLNRRLAPDTYLGVVPITWNVHGGFGLDGKDPIVDWLVQMRRLPKDLTLDTLIRHDELQPEQIDRLAEVLVRFYQGLSPARVDASDYRERCRFHVRQNRHELLMQSHHLPANLVKRVHAAQLQLLLLRPQLFDERVQSGRIVEGHGDLRPEHVCLTDPISIFDCIEFSEDLRRIDVADELSFLAAECDFLGADWVGPRLLETFARRSGDHPPEVLLDFYKAYRVCVRAKVAALRADQQQDTKEESLLSAAKYLELAERYIASWEQPLVFLVGGLSGTGKTTLAMALGDALGGEVLRTDIVRQELFGTPQATFDADSGIYGPPARDRVYADLLKRATSLHQQRLPVILDGTFASSRWIGEVKAIATEPNACFLAVECHCPADVAVRRIRQRLIDGRDASQARPDIHERQRPAWETWPTDLHYCRVDTQQPLARQVAQVLARIPT